MGIPGLKKLKATLKPRYGKMNKTEARYAAYLDSLKGQVGELVRWDFEPEKLRLADGAYYTPDFRVITWTGTVEFHEVKGFMREAAAVRLKVAADRHPYVFRLVRWKDKGWEVETV